MIVKTLPVGGWRSGAWIGHAIVPLVASVLLFSGLRFALARALESQRLDAVLWCAATLTGAALLTGRVRAAELAPAVRLTVRGLTLLFGVFVLFAPISIPAADLVAAGVPGWLFHDGRWLAVPLAAMAWFRPSVGFVIFAHVWTAKAAYPIIVGLPVTQTDWMIVWEAGVFLVLSAWVIRTWQCIAGRDDATRHRVGEWTLLMVVAVHFANYFYSGVWKLLLGPSPLTWLVENPTDALVLNAWQIGVLPLAVSGELAAGTYTLAHQVPVLINAATLAGQLLAPLALVQIVWQRWLTFYFDLQHLAIFLLTGIFFWKWIILNLLLFLALGRMQLRPETTGRAALVVLMLCAPVFFHIVYLAWYDTRVLNDVRLVAVTAAGKDVELSTNAALFGSVTFTQSRAGGPFAGAAVTDSLGATWRAEEMRAFKHCEAPGFAAAQAWRLPGSGPDLADLRRILRATFGFISERPLLARDLSRVHWYAHHVFANPALFPDLEGLPLAAINAVDVTVTARCTFLDGNRPGSVVLSAGRWRVLDGNDLERLR